MNVGDRVKFNSGYIDKDGEIVEVQSRQVDNWKPRYKVRVFKTLNINHENVRTWVGAEDIYLDIEYIRDKKLNDLGI